LLKGTLGWKESLFSSFHTFTNWQTKKDDPLFYGARIHFSPSFIHRSGILKKMTIEALEQGQPKAIKLNPEDRNKLVDIGKAVLGSLMRETDRISDAGNRSDNIRASAGNRIFRHGQRRWNRIVLHGS